MSNSTPIRFIETKQYQRFQEFCDACRRYQYIGLCYGVPGVGKTLSARHYANWDKVMAYDPGKTFGGGGVALSEVVGSSAVFYTVQVVNSPGHIQTEISRLREKLREFTREDLYRQRRERIAQVRRQEAEEQAALARTDLYYRATTTAASRADEALQCIYDEFTPQIDARPDPTQLILVDEADRLKMAALDQLRSLFDQGGMGLVLIGMPGLEKRLARYPQLYSRVGFVHEFKPLAQTEVRRLLREGWLPPGVSLPAQAWIDEEAIATLIRIAEGKFRLLHRLLTQIGRVMEINVLDKITRAVVEAARESLVIGTA
jgi:DNA transposition AAA+ family ATPase